MADETENKKARKKSDDLKQSFAWGQLFAGSLIGGLAVWKLGHKLTNTEPSEWFRGLSVAYEQWRDWLMTPLQWVHWDLAADDRNRLVLSVILGGAMFRAAIQFPRSAVRDFLWIAFWFPLSALALNAVFPTANGIRLAIALFFWVSIASCIVFPIALLRQSSGMQRESLFILLSVLTVIAWGTVLLLLNWATS